MLNKNKNEGTLVKRIVMSLVLGSLLGLNAATLEENQKMCEKDDLIACINLVPNTVKELKKLEVDNQADGMSKFYNLVAKLTKLSDKECKNNNKKACTLHTKYKKSLSGLPAAFVVDGLVSGEERNVVLKRKFKERADGLFDVMQGSFSELDVTLRKMPFTGDYLEYTTNILGEQATVKTFFTKKSNQLYAVVVTWNSSNIEGALNFSKNVEEELEKKYGKAKRESIDLPYISHIIRKPNKRASITLSSLMEGMFSFTVNLIYIDTKYQKIHELEKKIKETTKKL